MPILEILPVPTDKGIRQLQDNQAIETADEREAAAGSNTIVCVDNNFVNLTSIRLMLEMIGYKGDIQSFESSQMALNFIVAHSS